MEMNFRIPEAQENGPTPAVFICPGAPDKGTAYAYKYNVLSYINGNAYMGYIANYYLLPNGGAVPNHLRLSYIKRPSQVLFFTDGTTPVDILPITDYGPAFSWYAYNGGRDPVNRMNNIRHLRGCNTAYPDGHVETVKIRRDSNFDSIIINN
jgi:prepilin-type processing-associated H-X9-DG protein